MAEMLRELEEEIQRDKLQKFWRSFGTYLVVASLLIVLATVAAVLWQNYQQKQNLQTTLTLDMARDQAQAGKMTEAANTLSGIKEGIPPLISFARLQEANARLQAGEKDKASALLRQTAEDKNADPSMRQMARLLLLANTPSHDGDWRSQVEAAAKDGMPLASAAKEMLALDALESGKTSVATDLLKQIRDDMTAPATLRERANRLYLSLSSAQPAK